MANESSNPVYGNLARDHQANEKQGLMRSKKDGKI